MRLVADLGLFWLLLFVLLFARWARAVIRAGRLLEAAGRTGITPRSELSACERVMTQAPYLSVKIGIAGTAVGIVWALRAFDPKAVAKGGDPIQIMLESGVAAAFATTIVGLVLEAVFLLFNTATLRDIGERLEGADARVAAASRDLVSEEGAAGVVAGNTRPELGP